MLQPPLLRPSSRCSSTMRRSSLTSASGMPPEPENWIASCAAGAHQNAGCEARQGEERAVSPGRIAG